MNINIFGSTGNIGSLSLKLIKKFFPKIKINLLVANTNYKKLISQANIYNPKVIYINDHSKIMLIKKNINKNIKILQKDDINEYLKNSKSNLTILAISGYKSLNYFESILKNTYNLGLVNKECVVSAGHLFKILLKKNKVKLFPLHSEHFSLTSYFNKDSIDKYNKIYLTASGGPFLLNTFNDIKNVSFNEAIKHPKWKMGYKNSIDSSTLSNKCLELIEAHYLFDIPFKNLEAVIHPEALIHSVIELKNHTTYLNYFYHSMNIPLLNFLNLDKKIDLSINIRNNKYNFATNSNLNFHKVDSNKFPIFKIFKQLNKKNPKDFIKFNLSNEFAVELFKNKKISYGNIHRIINDSLSLDINNSINSIENIIKYHSTFNKLLKNKYEKI